MPQDTNQMEIMDQQEKQELATPLPVLPRLDRLDQLLQLLEEKHNLSGRHLCNIDTPKVEQEDPRKSLSSALEEVHHKGTLMERLTMLENRVVQLSSEMDEVNTSRSSSSTNIPASENLGHDSISSTVTTQDEDKIVTPQEDKDPAAVQEEAYTDAAVTEKTSQDINKKKRKRAYKKWFIGWFRMGC